MCKNCLVLCTLYKNALNWKNYKVIKLTAISKIHLWWDISSRCILRWLVLGKPIKIQCNYTCSCNLTKIFCLEFKILAITFMSSQWKALQSRKKIILTRIQYRHNYLNERRRLLLSICDAIQCGKMGNKI